MLEIVLSIMVLFVVILVGTFCFILHKKNNALLKGNNVLLQENMALVNANKSLEQKTLEISDEKMNLVKENIVINEEKVELKKENVKLLTTLEYEKKRFEELENNKEFLSLKFKDISHEIIKTQTKEFGDVQLASMKMHLDPLKTDIQVFKTQINEMTKEQRDGRVSLEGQIKMFQQGHLSLQKEAENLAKALRGNTKLQGDWGEMQLEKLLQMTGLKEGVEYTKQECLGSESGYLRPDYIIKLPDGKSIVLDSKVSLNNYLNYVQSEITDEQKSYFKMYIRDIREHITLLSGKDYTKWIKEDSLDFVCMFLPIEFAYIDALKEDSNLYQSAYDKHIVITTPSSLLPILRTVQLVWSTVKRNENVEKLAKWGGDLYDKLTLFSESFLKIGNALQNARGVYDKAMGQLKDGNGNAIRIAERMRTCGAKTTKRIPYELSAGNISTDNESNKNIPLSLKESSDINSSDKMDLLEEEFPDTIDL